MRFKFNTYEVEVKAKGYDSTRFNKQDTLAFLCSLYCDLIDARDSYKAKELFGCADAVQRSLDSIDAVLEENNYHA